MRNTLREDLHAVLISSTETILVFETVLSDTTRASYFCFSTEVADAEHCRRNQNCNEEASRYVMSLNCPLMESSPNAKLSGD
jgi:hypothetical protein